jgi:hemolysin D
MADSRNTELDFAPGILRVQDHAPSPLPRAVLYACLLLFAAMLAWAWIGRLDIIAVAQGKLVPGSYVKIVQPSESGIIAEILVQEGEEVKAGQVLMRMATEVSDADVATVETDLHLRRLQLRRIQAELNNRPFDLQRGDRPDLYQQVFAQYRANRDAHRDRIEGERAVLAKAEQELRGAIEMESRLRQTVPIFVAQENAFEKLANEGFVSKLAVLEKTRERIEREQELKAQSHQWKACARRSSSRSSAWHKPNRVIASCFRTNNWRRVRSVCAWNRKPGSRATGGACSS